MNSNNKELHKKKKSNLIFIAIAISFLFVNLQYLDFLYSWFTNATFFAFRNSFMASSLHLAALLAVDIISTTIYLQKRGTPSWKVIFILLFISNFVFYSQILFWILSSWDYFFVLLEAFPYFLILSVIDLLAVFINKNLDDSRVYIALLIVIIMLLFLGAISGFHYT